MVKTYSVLERVEYHPLHAAHISFLSQTVQRTNLTLDKYQYVKGQKVDTHHSINSVLIEESNHMKALSFIRIPQLVSWKVS